MCEVCSCGGSWYVMGHANACSTVSADVSLTSGNCRHVSHTCLPRVENRVQSLDAGVGEYDLSGLLSCRA